MLSFFIQGCVSNTEGWNVYFFPCRVMRNWKHTKISTKWGMEMDASHIKWIPGYQVIPWLKGEREKHKLNYGNWAWIKPTKTPTQPWSVPYCLQEWKVSISCLQLLNSCSYARYIYGFFSNAKQCFFEHADKYPEFIWIIINILNTIHNNPFLLSRTPSRDDGRKRHKEEKKKSDQEKKEQKKKEQDMRKKFKVRFFFPS